MKHFIVDEDIDYIEISRNINRPIILKDYLSITCCVCKTWRPLAQNFCRLACVYEDEIFKLGDRYYIIPDGIEHDACRELFRTNPLPYEH